MIYTIVRDFNAEVNLKVTLNVFRRIVKISFEFVCNRSGNERGGSLMISKMRDSSAVVLSSVCANGKDRCFTID